eukprot:2722303-Prymnesium_polylepis.1
MDATCSSCTARPAPACPFARLPLRPVHVLTLFITDPVHPHQSSGPCFGGPDALCAAHLRLTER